MQNPLPVFEGVIELFVNFYILAMFMSLTLKSNHHTLSQIQLVKFLHPYIWTKIGHGWWVDTRTVGGHSDGGWTLGRWVDTRAVGICSF